MKTTTEDTEAELLGKLTGYAMTIVASGILSPRVTAQTFVNIGAVIGQKAFGGVQMAEFLRDVADILERKDLAA